MQLPGDAGPFAQHGVKPRLRLKEVFADQPEVGGDEFQGFRFGNCVGFFGSTWPQDEPCLSFTLWVAARERHCFDIGRGRVLKGTEAGLREVQGVDDVVPGAFMSQFEGEGAEHLFAVELFPEEVAVQPCQDLLAEFQAKPRKGKDAEAGDVHRAGDRSDRVSPPVPRHQGDRAERKNPKQLDGQEVLDSGANDDPEIENLVFRDGAPKTERDGQHGQVRNGC